MWGTIVDGNYAFSARSPTMLGMGYRMVGMRGRWGGATMTNGWVMIRRGHQTNTGSLKKSLLYRQYEREIPAELNEPGTSVALPESPLPPAHDDGPRS